MFRGGYMYVASEYTNQVLQYDATTGAYVGVFVAAGSGGINGPNGMAFGFRRQPVRLRAEQQQRGRSTTPTETPWGRTSPPVPAG